MWHEGLLVCVQIFNLDFLSMPRSECNAFSRLDNGVYFDKTSTRPDGKTIHSTGKIPCINLSLNHIPASTDTAHLSTAPNWTFNQRSPCWTDSTTLAIMSTWFLDADLWDMFCMGQIRSCHFPGKNYFRNRLEPAAILKKRTANQRILDVLQHTKAPYSSPSWTEQLRRFRQKQVHLHFRCQQVWRRRMRLQGIHTVFQRFIGVLLASYRQGRHVKFLKTYISCFCLDRPFRAPVRGPSGDPDRRLSSSLSRKQLS